MLPQLPYHPSLLLAPASNMTVAHTHNEVQCQRNGSKQQGSKRTLVRVLLQQMTHYYH